MSVNVEVKLKKGESVERLIKRFKKKVTKEKILEQCKDKMFFTKKSDRKRLERKKAKYYQKKEQEKKNRENKNA